MFNLDRKNKGNISLKLLAKQFGIPSWLVALRHISTHSILNSDRNFILYSLNFCLLWLVERHWMVLMEKLKNPVKSCSKIYIFKSYEAKIKAKIEKCYDQSNLGLSDSLLKIFKHEMAYHVFIDSHVNWLLAHDQISPLKWSSKFISQISYNFPLYFHFLLEYILNNTKFHYKCILFYNTSNWNKFKSNLVNYLTKTVNISSLNNLEMISELILKSFKVIFLIIEK